MYFELAGYGRFSQAEVGCLGWFIVRNEGPRGGGITETRTMICEVDALVTGQAAISAFYENLLTRTQPATFDYAGFLRDDFTPTPVYMRDAGSLSGLKMIQRPSWTPKEQVEFATMATFQFIMQAEYPVASNDPLIDYAETLSFDDEGPGGRIRSLVTDTGPVELFKVANNTGSTIVQQGFAVGRDAPPAYNAPLYSLPMINRNRTRTTPRFRGRTFIGYEATWRYVFVSVDAVRDGFPQLR